MQIKAYNENIDKELNYSILYFLGLYECSEKKYCLFFLIRYLHDANN